MSDPVIMLTEIDDGIVEIRMQDKLSKNTFSMPFLMEADEAVGHILRGLEAKRFAINFPWQMTFGTKLLGAFPGWAKFSITRKMVPKG